MTHDVFVSYQRDDLAVAEMICETLEAEGIACWMAPRNQLAGKTYGKQITEAIRKARVMVLVFSEHANQSEAVQNEVFLAIEFGAAVLPFKIENIEFNEELEYHLKRLHWLRAFPPPIENYVSELVGNVRRLLGMEERTVDPVPPPSPPSPPPTPPPAPSPPPPPPAPPPPPLPPPPTPKAPPSPFPPPEPSPWDDPEKRKRAVGFTAIVVLIAAAVVAAIIGGRPKPIDTGDNTTVADSTTAASNTTDLGLGNSSLSTGYLASLANSLNATTTAGLDSLPPLSGVIAGAGYSSPEIWNMTLSVPGDNRAYAGPLVVNGKIDDNPFITKWNAKLIVQYMETDSAPKRVMEDCTIDKSAAIFNVVCSNNQVLAGSSGYNDDNFQLRTDSDGVLAGVSVDAKGHTGTAKFVRQ